MNDHFEELDNLLKGLAQETLNETQRLRLEEILASDPEAMERYLDYIEVESMLSTHKVKISHSRKGTSRNITTGKRKTAFKKVSKKKKSSGAILAAAALLMLAGGLFLYVKSVKANQYFATVMNIEGEAKITNASSSEKATEEMRLKPNSEIECPLGANSIQILTKDGSTHTISGGSKIKFSWRQEEKLITVYKGYLKSNIKKQPFAKPMKIKTPHALMTVLGTSLRAELKEKTTILTVDEGKVEIDIGKSSKRIIEEGQIAVAGSKDIMVRNIKEFRVKNLKIISVMYGAGEKWLDVTVPVRNRAGNSRLILTGPFVHLAGDPYHKHPKSLKITYKVNGQQATAVFYEYRSETVSQNNYTEEIILPVPLK